MATGEDKSIMKQLDDITECSICSERFTDPRSLPCVHSFCLKCVERFARDKQPGTKLPCPMCRNDFVIPDGGVSDLPKNFFIGKLMHIKMSVSGSTPSVCDSCQLDEVHCLLKKSPTVYCVECREKYCEDCARYHKTSKLSRSHRLVKLDECGELCHQEEILCKSSPTLCEKHPDQALSVYCRDCKSAICVICYIASHKQHDCSDINDVIEKFRDLMTSDVSSLADVAGKLRETLASIEQQKQDFSKMVSDAEVKICEKAAEDITLIERKKQTLLNELMANQRDVVKRFDNLGHEILQHLSLLDNLKKYTDELSKKGAGADIAREMSVLHDRVEELLKVDAIEESRDEMDSTDVKFTASTVLAIHIENAIGKIDVIISAKVQKEKPTITLKHDKVEAAEKENVRITSTITGVPEPNVECIIGLTRFKDNVQLTPSSRITIERNGNDYSLMINQVSQQDAGQYTVRATNSVGITEAVATLKVNVLKPTTPSLKHVISIGGGWVVGVRSLSNQLFVVRRSAQQQIEVYETATFTSQKNISVSGLDNTWGLASCAVNNVLYVTESTKNRVYRVSLQSGSNTVTQWSVGKQPFGISVNSVNNVLVTCAGEHKIQEYNTNGSLIRDISLSSAGINYPYYAIQLPNGQLAINNSAEEVYVVDNNGALIRKYTNTTGASIQLSNPRQLALVQNGCALLANYGAHQIVLFNPSFTSARALSLPSDSALQHPRSLFFDESRGRLYVGEYSGRVLVFDNVFNVGSDFQ